MIRAYILIEEDVDWGPNRIIHQYEELGVAGYGVVVIEEPREYRQA
jgi:hypothetical protein